MDTLCQEWFLLAWGKTPNSLDFKGSFKLASLLSLSSLASPLFNPPCLSISCHTSFPMALVKILWSPLGIWMLLWSLSPECSLALFSLAGSYCSIRPLIRWFSSTYFPRFRSISSYNHTRPPPQHLSRSIVIAHFPLFYHQTKPLTCAQKEAAPVKSLSFQVQEPGSNPSSCIHKLCALQKVS